MNESKSCSGIRISGKPSRAEQLESKKKRQRNTKTLKHLLEDQCDIFYS